MFSTRKFFLGTNKALDLAGWRSYFVAKKIGKTINEHRGMSVKGTQYGSFINNLADYMQTTLRDFRANIKNCNRVYTELKFERPGYLDTAWFSVTDPNCINHGQAYMVALKYYKDALLQNFRRHRQRERTPYVEERSLYIRRLRRDLSVYTVGGVHQVPGYILDLKNQINSSQVFVAKRPQTAERHIGIELEFLCKANDTTLAGKLTEAGLAGFVELKADGSLRSENDNGYRYTHELCILAQETEFETVVSRVCEVLEQVGVKVNTSCGMHVHVDMRDRDRGVVFSNLVSSQSILYAMNPKTRAQNKFCKRTRRKKFFSSSNRYHGINPGSYSRHGTIEVRIHAGTINAKKIVNWCKILLAVANRPAPIVRSPRTLKGFKRQFGISDELELYIAERIEKFYRPENENIVEAA